MDTCAASAEISSISSDDALALFDDAYTYVDAIMNGEPWCEHPSIDLIADLKRICHGRMPYQLLAYIKTTPIEVVLGSGRILHFNLPYGADIHWIKDAIHKNERIEPEAQQISTQLIQFDSTWLFSTTWLDLVPYSRLYLAVRPKSTRFEYDCHCSLVIAPAPNSFVSTSTPVEITIDMTSAYAQIGQRLVYHYESLPAYRRLDKLYADVLSTHVSISSIQNTVCPSQSPLGLPLGSSVHRWNPLHVNGAYVVGILRDRASRLPMNVIKIICNFLRLSLSEYEKLHPVEVKCSKSIDNKKLVIFCTPCTADSRWDTNTHYHVSLTTLSNTRDPNPAVRTTSFPYDNHQKESRARRSNETALQRAYHFYTPHHHADQQPETTTKTIRLTMRVAF